MGLANLWTPQLADLLLIGEIVRNLHTALLEFVETHPARRIVATAQGVT